MYSVNWPNFYFNFLRPFAKPTGEESSTGLGLSLVKRYTEQIGGKVWFDRDASKGATFIVELPSL
ncbi:sensor histidine kinase [Ekhidna sp.]